ncbi:MFS transporter [Flaviflexus equikiangi]|uniref:MFS transporter n=1 Tax=Flaviflexus equikiangi TaxID=2758573 RepID=A0ABS2TER0_9ACTO|nr:MFS transporter [Flaviflexus equikiangi]MBM9433144.1 MFS transporter [Flaviflexus equikiangi]
MRIWLAGMAVYIMAIAARTSFGVASLDALERFDISAAELSMFTVIQLGVYAVCQIPLGLLLDRFGSRPIIVAGAIILGAGQIWLALAGTYPSALAARILIGMGDATAFTSVLRLIPQWFPPRKVPLYTQLTGLLGQAGQVISSIPFAMALAHVGWEKAFLGMGVTGAVVGLVAAFFIRERTSFVTATTKPSGKTLTHPGVWQGFWAHFTLGFPVHVFLLLWGVPFMVVNGIPQTTASALLIVCSAAGIVTGPLVASVTARHPLRRPMPVIAITALLVGTWAYILLLERPVEVWEFTVLLIVLALAGPGSSIGFDFARTAVPVSRLGTANGLVNQGGFTAALISAFLIGVVLDTRAPDGDYTRTDFRLAMASQAIIVAVGIIGFLAVGPAARRRFEKDKGLRIEPARVAIERIMRERRAEARLRASDRNRSGQAGEGDTPPGASPATGPSTPPR